MKLKIVIFIIYFLCGNSYAKINFDGEKLKKSFDDNNIAEIYKTTSTFRNVEKNLSIEEIELYKTIYLAAIYRYEKAQDYGKVYKTTSDVLKSNIFNSDKEFLKKIVIHAAKALENNRNCKENTKFILNNIEDGSLINSRTDFLTNFLIDTYISSSLIDSINDSSCVSQFLEKLLVFEFYTITKNKKYDAHNAAKIAKIILAKTNEIANNNETLKNYILIEDFTKKLIANNRADEAISFLYDIHNQVLPELLENTLIETEEHVLNFKRSTSDFLFIKRLNLAAKYLGGEQWPFKKTREKTIREIFNYRSQDKATSDLMLVILSKQALAIANSSDKKSANELYQRILAIDTNKTASNFGNDLKTAFELMISAFKISSALSRGDLKSANLIRDEKINHLIDFFNSSKDLEHLKKGLTNDQIIILIKPFLEYEIELGRKEEAKKLILIATKSQDFELDKYGDIEYLKNNKAKFNNKITTFLYLLRDYYEFTKEDDELSKTNLAIAILVPGSYNESRRYFPALFSAVSNEDITSGKFYLEVYKDNLRNFKNEVTYFLYVDIYQIFLTAFNTYPGESATTESKLFWKKTVLEKTYNDYGLMYFLDNAQLGYFDKISILESLLVGSRVLEKSEDEYTYSNIYLNLISEGINSAADHDLLKSFKDNKISEIENIIGFYIENNYLFEAQNAISIFKQQSFFELLGTQGDKMRGLSSYNSNNERIISSKIKTLNIQLDLIEKRINNERDPESISKLIQLKSNLMRDLEQSRKVTQNTLPSKESDYSVNQIRDTQAYVDFFFKSDTLNVIYQDKNGLIKISNSVDLKSFSRAIQELYSNYTKNSSTDSKESINLIYKTLFSSIEELLIKSKIKNIHIRSNSFITSIPIKHLISTKSDSLKDVNIIYQGVPNSRKAKFSLDSRSALFATTQKFGNLPALNAANSEVNYIFDTYKKKFSSRNQARKFVNKDFSIEKFSSEFASQSSVIHIASHFSANRDSGGLLLGTGQIVTPKEIWTQLASTNTSKLITISACESGLFNGQGQSIEDLPNVFLNKGATFVVATLWKISDNATADFMHIFYDLLMLSGDPAYSLNSTQTSFAVGNFTNIEEKYGVDEEFKRKHESALRKYSSPYFWAGFQLISSN